MGGAEIMLLNLLSKMDRNRFSPEVISLAGIGLIGKKIKELGIPVYGMNMSQGRINPILVWRFIRFVKRLHPNLIQGWMYHGNLAAQFVNSFLNKPVHVLWSIHHSVDNISNEKITTAWVIRLCAKISKRPSKIIYVAKSSAIQHKNLGFFPDRSCVIHNGYNSDQFVPSERARAQIRNEMGLPLSSQIIGLIARYHPMKDHENFLKAAYILRKSYPDVHFLLAGENLDSNNKTLMDLVQGLNLKNRVHFLGLRQDNHTLNAALDISTNTSYFGECFSIAVGEAMSCEVPCVVTDVGDSSLLVDNTGIVVPPRSPEALARGWEELLNMGHEGRRKLGRQARERIVSNFSLDKIVSQYESLYYDLFIAPPF